MAAGLADYIVARGTYGLGTVFVTPRGRWCFQVTAGRDESGKRVRLSFTGYTEASAIAAQAHYHGTGEMLPSEAKRGPGQVHRTPKVRIGPAKVDVIRLVLAEARLQAWDDDYLARVLAAQLARRRLSRNITGPCAYCGTWLAHDIDHQIPTSRGGSDNAENIVSCCDTCNGQKGKRTVEEWRAA